MNEGDPTLEGEASFWRNRGLVSYRELAVKLVFERWSPVEIK